MDNPVSGYTREKDRPFTAYALLVGLFNSLLGVLLFRARLGQSVENPLTLEDVAILGVATHKLSRIITKDVVTSPFRAPFTRFEHYLGYGEEQCESRGRGLASAIGELLSCNYCADVWIALGLLAALDRAPRRARLALKLFTAISVSDFLHVQYETTRTEGNVLTLREEKLERSQAG